MTDVGLILNNVLRIVASFLVGVFGYYCKQEFERSMDRLSLDWKDRLVSLCVAVVMFTAIIVLIELYIRW